eukprot:6482192-Amphidinium_carterae.1
MSSRPAWQFDSDSDKDQEVVATDATNYDNEVDDDDDDDDDDNDEEADINTGKQPFAERGWVARLEHALQACGKKKQTKEV